MVIDIAYLSTCQGSGYLSLVTNAFSRRIVGHHDHASLHTAGGLAALDRAGCGATSCIHHFNHGSQYVSDAHQATLKKAKRRCLMTDGSYQYELAKRVNEILKDEFLFFLPEDLAQARLLANQAVHLYNEERPHLEWFSSCGTGCSNASLRVSALNDNR